MSTGEPCPMCGIVPGEQLEPAAYEAIWDAIPDLKAAQGTGTSIHCPECGRQLTFADGLPENLEDIERGARHDP